MSPGDPVDVEANRRGQTLYGADSKIRLHPKVLSQDAASLLPGQVRPALLWTIKVDEAGEGTEARVERALVRSRAKLAYDDVQRQVDAGDADDLLGLLRELGEPRRHREAERGGVSLPLRHDACLRPEGQPVRERDLEPRRGRGVAAVGRSDVPRDRGRRRGALPRKGVVVVQEPAVEAAVTSSSTLPLGENVTVKLAVAHPDARSVRFELA